MTLFRHLNCIKVDHKQETTTKIRSFVGFTSDALGETFSFTVGYKQYVFKYEDILKMVNRERAAKNGDSHFIIDESDYKTIPIEWIKDRAEANKDRPEVCRAFVELLSDWKDEVERNLKEADEDETKK